VQLEKVTVQGSLTNKFEPRVESDQELSDNGLEQLSEDGAEVDFTQKPIIIQEATVRRYGQGESTIPDDNSSAYNSDNEYRFRVEQKPRTVQRKMNLFQVIKV